MWINSWIFNKISQSLCFTSLDIYLLITVDEYMNCNQNIIIIFIAKWPFVFASIGNWYCDAIAMYWFFMVREIFICIRNWFNIGHYNMQALKQKCHCPDKLVALEVVKMTTPSAACDEDFIKMTFPFQWVHIILSQWWFHQHVNQTYKTVFQGNSVTVKCFGINFLHVESAATVLIYF